MPVSALRSSPTPHPASPPPRVGEFLRLCRDPDGLAALDATAFVDHVEHLGSGRLDPCELAHCAYRAEDLAHGVDALYGSRDPGARSRGALLTIGLGRLLADPRLAPLHARNATLLLYCLRHESPTPWTREYLRSLTPHLRAQGEPWSIADFDLALRGLDRHIESEHASSAFAALGRQLRRTTGASGARGMAEALLDLRVPGNARRSRLITAALAECLCAAPEALDTRMIERVLKDLQQQPASAAGRALADLCVRRLREASSAADPAVAASRVATGTFVEAVLAGRAAAARAMETARVSATAQALAACEPADRSR